MKKFLLLVLLLLTAFSSVIMDAETVKPLPKTEKVTEVIVIRHRHHRHRWFRHHRRRHRRHRRHHRKIKVRKESVPLTK
jgi:hypothetical protein